ncbi:MAG: ATP-binding protein [Candidatus Zapsychrus exili]|nr:ATP-binding protein [Candidatus Zapsychrus exili]
MYIKQKQLENIKNRIIPSKVFIIYGPRRCGKTTLLNKYLKSVDQKYLMVNGDDITVQSILSSQSIEKLKNFVGNNRLLVIDEAQKIENIGLNLKLIIDNIDSIIVLATGSSAFDLAQKIGEPLTGRKLSFQLFPISQLELSNIENVAQTKSLIESRLIYGSYPEVILQNDNTCRIEYLKEVVGSYLYKDILELDSIRSSDKLIRLLQLLAFQIGKTVSCAELGSQLTMSKNTVSRYLDLLEKSFVIFRIGGFSRNLRKEIAKISRYYFYDVGIRNAVINNFNTFDMRNDLGELWENYIIVERIKKQQYTGVFSNNYFWRTYDQKEIDWIEERDGKLYGYEIKWKNSSNCPKEFKQSYPNSEYETINQDNYLSFIC